MNLRDLAQFVLSGDDLSARQLVKDAKREGVSFASSSKPDGMEGDELAVAASLAEMFADREGHQPPPWTGEVGPASRPVYLSKMAATSPAIRRACERGAPEPLRRRNIYAFNNFLKVL